MASALDIFVAYKFIKLLTTDWEDTDAFQLGIIDAEGNLLKKRKELETSEEKRAYTIFHTLVWNIKRLLDKLPPTRTKLGSFAAALWLLKEHTQSNMGVDDFEPALMLFENLVKTHYSARIDLFESHGFDPDENPDTIESGLYEILDRPSIKAQFHGRTFSVNKEDYPHGLKSIGQIAGEFIFRVKIGNRVAILTKKDIEPR